MNPTLGQLIVKIGADTRQLKAAFSDVKSAVLNLQSGLATAGATLTQRVTLPLLALGTASVLAAGNLQQARLGLETVAGSAEEAERQLERLRVLARNPGLGFRQAIDASVKLQTLGFSAEQAEAAIRELGNAVALTGGTREDFGEIARQFSQIRSLGRLTAENLNVIIERSPAVAAAMQTAFGSASAEAIRESGIGIDEFFERLQAGLETLPRARASILDTFGNLRDDISTAIAPLGEVIAEVLIPVFTRVVAFVTRLSDAFKALSPEQQRFIVYTIGAAAALGPVLIALTGLVAVLGVLFTPLGAVAIAIGAVIAVAVTMYAKSEALRESLSRLWDIIGDNVTAFASLADAIASLSLATGPATQQATSLGDALRSVPAAVLTGLITLLGDAIFVATQYVNGLRAAFETLASGRFATGFIQAFIDKFRELAGAANDAAQAIAKVRALTLGKKAGEPDAPSGGGFAPLVTGAGAAADAVGLAEDAVDDLRDALARLRPLQAEVQGLGELFGTSDAGIFEDDALRRRVEDVAGELRTFDEVVVEAMSNVSTLGLAMRAAFTEGFGEGVVALVRGLSSAVGNLAGNLAEFRNLGETLRTFADQARRAFGDLVAAMVRAVAQALILRAVLFGLNFLGLGGIAGFVGGAFGLKAGALGALANGAIAGGGNQPIRIVFEGGTPVPGGMFFPTPGGYVGAVRRELQIEKGGGLGGTF